MLCVVKATKAITGISLKSIVNALPTMPMMTTTTHHNKHKPEEQRGRQRYAYVVVVVVDVMY